MAQVVHPNIKKRYGKELREMAMNGVQRILESFRDCDDKRRSAQLCRNFFPGVVSACMKILLGDSKQGTPLFVSALKVLGIIVCLVLSDEEQLNEQDVQEGHDALKLPAVQKSTQKYLEKLSNVLHESPTIDEKASDTKSWIKNTSSRVSSYLAHLFRTTKNDISGSNSVISELKLNPHSIVPTEKLGWKFRYQQALFCHEVLTHCSLVLNRCVSVMFETLVALTEDENTDISNIALKLLKELPLTLLKSTYRDSLRIKLMTLPRILSDETDAFKFRFLRLCNGLLRLQIDLSRQKNTTFNFFTDEKEVLQLTKSVLQGMSLDYSDINVIERTELQDRFYELRFLKCTDAELRKVLLELVELYCQLIRIDFDVFEYAQMLLDIGKNGLVSIQCEAVFMLECTIASIIHENISSQPIFHETMRSVLEELLDESIWNANVSRPEEQDANVLKLHDEISLEDISEADLYLVEAKNRKEMMVSLSIRLTGIIGEYMKDHFPLIDFLYPLLEHYGSDSFLISDTAKVSLLKLAKVYSCDTIEQLVESNADYFIDSVSFQLRYGSNDTSAASMLQALLQKKANHSDILCPLLYDLINDVLSSLNIYNSDTQRINLYLKCLKCIVSYLAGSMSAEKSKDFQETELIVNEFYSGQYIRNELNLLIETIETERLEQEKFASEFNHLNFTPPHLISERNKLKEDMSNDLENDGLGNEEGDHDSAGLAADLNSAPTDNELKVIQICDKCLSFISSTIPSLQILALESLIQGMKLLSHRENALLPVIARIWTVIQPNYSKTNHRDVFFKLFELIETMGEYADRFIARRIRNELWPVLRVVLVQIQKEVVRDRLAKRPYFESTVQFKLQQKILNFIYRACSWKDVSLDILDVTKYLLTYVIDQHNEKLTAITMQIFKSFLVEDSDLMWSELRSLSHSSDLVERLLHEIEAIGEQRISIW
jgi:hypothetical protein